MDKPHIGHIGIIVEDMSLAIEKLTGLLGVAPENVKEISGVGLKVAEFKMANVTLELLQYTENECFAKEVMGERLGLNHLSVTVNDVNEAIGTWTEKGMVLGEGFPRDGAHGRVAFFRTEPKTGILFEVCQPFESGGH